MDWRELLKAVTGGSESENSEAAASGYASGRDAWQYVDGTDFIYQPQTGIYFHQPSGLYYHPQFEYFEPSRLEEVRLWLTSMEAYKEVLQEQQTFIPQVEQPQTLIEYDREKLAKLLYYNSAPFFIECPDQNTSTSFLIAAARANPKHRKVKAVTHEPKRWEEAFGIYGEIPKWDSWEGYGINTIYRIGEDHTKHHFKDTLLLVDNANTAVHYTEGEGVSSYFLNRVTAGPPRKIDTVVTYLASDVRHDNIPLSNFLLNFGASQKFNESQFR